MSPEQSLRVEPHFITLSQYELSVAQSIEQDPHGSWSCRLCNRAFDNSMGLVTHVLTSCDQPPPLFTFSNEAALHICMLVDEAGSLKDFERWIRLAGEDADTEGSDLSDDEDSEGNDSSDDEDGEGSDSDDEDTEGNNPSDNTKSNSTDHDDCTDDGASDPEATGSEGEDEPETKEEAGTEPVWWVGEEEQEEELREPDYAPRQNRYQRHKPRLFAAQTLVTQGFPPRRHL